MGKQATATKSFAEQGLEDVQGEVNNTSVISSIPKEVETEEEYLHNVGGLEPVEAFYQTKPPKNPGKTPILLFQEDEVMNGIFERIWEKEMKTAEGRRFTSYTYLVRLNKDKKLYGFSGPGLGRIDAKRGNTGFQALEPGHDSKVQVIYTGSNVGKDGNTYENFIIRGSKPKGR